MLFLKLGGPIRLGKFLTQDLLRQRLPNFNIVSQVYNLSFGRNLMQFHQHFIGFLDFT